MFLINKEKNRVSKIEEQKFSDLGFKERVHLQEWIANDSCFFGEDLLIIQKEFAGFDDTRERLDLLAIDKFGDIVVIENKLDDSGRDIIWQVLKYASYCSSLSKHQIKAIFQQYLIQCGTKEEAESIISEFMNADDFDEVELNKSQRIIMVSVNFRKEVTSTVLWLLNNYKLKIQCFKATPYSLGDQLILNIEQIIPVKEAEEYMIRMAEKKLEDADTQEEVKTRHKIRLDFWQQLLAFVNQSDTKLFQNINPSKDNWISAGVGVSGLGLNFVVSKQACRIELYISRGNQEENKFIFDQLYAQKDQIESVFGGKLTWERLDFKKSCRIRHELAEVNVYEKDDWEPMIEFLTDGIIRMENALIKPLRIINQKLKRGLNYPQQ